MRFLKFITLFFLTGFVLLAATACAAKTPRIQIEPASQELGEVPQERIELTYTVTNSGRDDLQIEKITTSCDCTKAVMSQNVIAPDQSAILTVSLDPTEDNLYGNVTRVIYLRSNDPENPEVSVEFHALIKKP